MELQLWFVPYSNIVVQKTTFQAICAQVIVSPSSHVWFKAIKVGVTVGATDGPMPPKATPGRLSLSISF